MDATTTILGAKNDCLLGLIEQHLGRSFPHILVVGCGTGHEAQQLAARFNGETDGIDLGVQFPFIASTERVHLQVMDARAMRFPDATFDLIYSFHALEHIIPLEPALAEMRRVAKPGAAYCIGTPNKNRLLGYLGGDATTREKIRWNIDDWRMRLRGSWRNEAGAHAGFTRTELRNLCARSFGAPIDITDA